MADEREMIPLIGFGSLRGVRLCPLVRETATQWLVDQGGANPERYRRDNGRIVGGNRGFSGWYCLPDWREVMAHPSVKAAVAAREAARADIKAAEDALRAAQKREQEADRALLSLMLGRPAEPRP